MDEVIFADFGIEIIKRFGRTFIRYDAGEIAAHFVEAEIADEEAKKAQESEDAAYRVILATQRREPI
jgi:hypothetical protein